VREFRRHEVEFVILKGAVLAFMAYPDSSLRPVSDVDLLVRPESLAKTLKLIGDAGFKCPKRFEFTDPLMVKDFVVPGEEISLGLRPLLDIHLWVELQAKRLDWDGIRGESIVRGYRDWMYLTLKMVRDCFATGIPSEFFTQMEAPLKLNQLESLAYEQIWLNH